MGVQIGCPKWVSKMGVNWCPKLVSNVQKKFEKKFKKVEKKLEKMLEKMLEKKLEK
jgi:Skp family chaperone for outer membrane proteins